MKKLTIGELNAEFIGSRNDHPGRKQTENIVPPKLVGRMYPNPYGCRGLRFVDSRRQRRRIGK